MGEVVDLFNNKQVSARCMSCGEVHSCIVDGSAWDSYTSNRSSVVQEVSPDEDTATREILIAGRLNFGITGRCSLYMCEKCCNQWDEE